MTNKSIVNITLAVLSLILFSSVAATAQKKTDCTKTTDADIVKAIYDEMKKKPDYEKQMIHVNVVSKDGVVTLQGWATTAKIKKAIEKIARKNKCVKSVVNQLGDGPVGCGPGQKKCGDICIGIEDTCNICTAKTCL
jgi:osmotically-inducible protein OsmY